MLLAASRSEASSLQAASRKLRTIAHAVFGITSIFVFLFLFYWQVSYPLVPFEDLTRAHVLHIAKNLLANAIVVFIACQLRGAFSTKIHYALFSAVLVHCALIILIFLMREYYSRPMIIGSFSVSIALITATVCLLEKWRPVRIGVVPSDSQREVGGWLQSEASILPSPSADIRRYDIVLVDWSSLDPRWNALLARAALSGCVVEHIARYIETRNGRVSIDHFELSHATSSTLYLTFVKRPIDIILAGILLPLSLPLLLPAMIAIRISMGSPVLFTQLRVGRGGKPFRLYKLRTMRLGSDKTSLATAQGDPRITPLGKFLRRTRIDELPQLVNILKGDMSLVGPRPEQPGLSNNYERDLPSFAYRHTVPPGLTGWAQINAGYAANAEETRVKLTYDLYYLKHVSLLLDLWIMVQTARAIVAGTSAR